LEKQKEKRARFCHVEYWKGRQQESVAAQLADLLRQHRNSFPGFASRIDQFIATVESDSKRSRSYDHAKVVELLRAWGFGLTVKELMDDTGYSHWDIRQILAALMKKGLVIRQDKLRTGRRIIVYKLK
jgi:hypothetical protein